MGRVGQSALYEQDGEVYLIVDEASYEVNCMGLAATWVCETAAQLESEIGLPAGSLQSTVDPLQPPRRGGGGPALPQGRRLGAPAGAAHRRDRPPHWARARRAVHPGWFGDRPSPARCRDLSGSAIPGLFAAGRTTAGVCSFGYASGLSIGDSTLFGRLVGESAATAPFRRRQSFIACKNPDQGYVGYEVDDREEQAMERWTPICLICTDAPASGA